MPVFVERFFLTNTGNCFNIFSSEVVQIKGVQELIEVSDIRNGVIVLKNQKHIKILKVFPINFNLKSNHEKEQILNQYSQFLKICNFNFQILIKTKKEKVDNHINYIKSIKIDNFVLQEEYIKYISNLINSEYIYSKEFYIIFSLNNLEKSKNIQEIENEMNKIVLVVKENFLKCGNKIEDITIKDEQEVCDLLATFISNGDEYETYKEK